MKPQISKKCSTERASVGTTKRFRITKREQELSYAQQALVRQLQEESGAEMDTLVKSVKIH